MEEYQDYSRYSRQTMLPDIGENGQRKLAKAKVLVIGAGGLGSPVLFYLTAAGIGTIGIADFDQVDITNLQRQILHWEKDLGKNKSASAIEKLSQFNSQVNFKSHNDKIDLKSAKKIIPQYDLVVSAVDNIETRYVINQVCYEKQRPWIEGAVANYDGYVTTFSAPHGPCYKCLYPDTADHKSKPPGLLGTLPGVIGMIQAQEALKMILGIGDLLNGRLLIYDARGANFNTVAFRPNPQCPICGNQPKRYKMQSEHGN